MKKPLDFMVRVNVNGMCMFIEVEAEGLRGVTNILGGAIADRDAGKPGYFCQFNKIDEGPAKGVDMVVIWSTMIDGWYISGNEQSFSERSLELGNKQIEIQQKMVVALEKAAEVESDGDEWKQRAGDD